MIDGLRENDAAEMTGTITFVEMTCCAAATQQGSRAKGDTRDYLAFPRKGPRARSYKPPLVGWPRLSKTVGLTICLTEMFSTSLVL
jgi:hypothetical protein